MGQLAASTALLRGLTESDKGYLQSHYVPVVRSGVVDPALVCEHVKARLTGKLPREQAERLLQIVETRRDDALALAAHNIEMQSLPPEVRKQIKAQMAEEAKRECIAKQQPTRRQMPIDSKQHASDLIDQRKA
jgi:hypothetical protein